jgi:dihydropteroate synthase
MTYEGDNVIMGQSTIRGMDYHEAADVLTGLQQRRPKLGVETTARMLAHLDNPHASIDCVQIAGSNGKGSTARMLEQILDDAGLRVGLFTSPGLNDFREQIRVEGRTIAKKHVSKYVERLVPCLETLRADNDEPTHFEALTAVSLAHFAAMDVDIAILEVGIGGRYDATSAVDPIASAVTSVSLEHTELLGETVDVIARDKAQVAPSEAPLITGTTGDALAAIREETDVITVGNDSDSEADIIATETGIPSPIESAVSIVGSEWAVETHLPLVGAHQATNAGVAAALARQVQDVSIDTIETGLRGATWPGRFELMSHSPRVVLDGSHNPGATATLGSLLERYEYDELHVVFAAMQDKDHEAMIQSLPSITTAYATEPAVERAETAETLAPILQMNAKTVETIQSVPEATEEAIETAGARSDDLVLVTGSLYAVAEARDRWTRLLVPVNRSSSIDIGVGKESDNAVSERVNPGYAEAMFETDKADVTTQCFRTTLRPAQVEIFADHVAAAGGFCHQTTVGSPQKLTAIVFGGTTRDLMTLSDSLVDAGHGLRHVGSQLQRQLTETTPVSVSGLNDTRTAVMGILNITPDSFYDGGEYNSVDAAMDQANTMIDAGVDILDVGGESTRPGAEPVPISEEIDRIVPVIEALSNLEVPISIDTRKAAVADAALSAGADIVNDVSGFDDPEMPFVVAEHDAELVLMHSLSAPVDPDRRATYDDVVTDVMNELTEQLLRAERAGIQRDQIIVDPGCGFGKSPAESFELVDRIDEFEALGCPVLVGHSRKSMLATMNQPDDERLSATIAVTTLAADRGADVVRVHDAGENAAAVRAAAAAKHPYRAEDDTTEIDAETEADDR